MLNFEGDSLANKVQYHQNANTEREGIRKSVHSHIKDLSNVDNSSIIGCIMNML